MATVIGMGRAGSNFLYYQLRKHPKVSVPALTEVSFYSRFFSRGFDWYKKQFKGDTSQVGIDVSANYYLQDNFVHRVNSFDPNTKIILGVRKPSNWILSYFQQMRTFDFSVNNMEKFITEFEWDDREKVRHINMSDNYLPNQIELYKKEFKGRLLVYDFAYLHNHPVELLQQIEHFLEIPSFFNEANYEDIKVNASGRKNNRFLLNIISNDRFRLFVNDFLPQSFIDKLRTWYVRSGSPKKSVKVEHDPLHKELADKLLASQDEYYQEMFKEKGVLIY